MRDAAGAVKIGISDDVAQRVWALQGVIGARRCPLQIVKVLRLPRSISGRVERRTHRLLELFRIEGEWFRVSKPLALKALDEAVRQITAKSAFNGKLSKGRPTAKFTADEMRDAKAVWRNPKDYPTWADAVAAFPEGFTSARAFKLWGKRT